MIITNSGKNRKLLGSNNKNLNKRVLSSVDLDNSNLVVDIFYYSKIIENKLKCKNSSFRQKWLALISGKNNLIALQAVDELLDIFVKIKRLVNIKSIILLTESLDKLSPVEKELYKILTTITSRYLISSKDNFIRSLYSLAVKEKETYIILSDNLNFWSICSNKSNIHHCIIYKNNNIRFYTDKFGLEYLSSLIQTNKLVNKLRLSKLKYVNLQYLYILLLYTQFKYAKKNSDLDISDKEFSGSKGKALEMLSNSHREISYYFLTKKDMIDIFLTSSATHFTLNLSRLLKIDKFGTVLMSGFANFYASNAIKQIPVKLIDVSKIYYKLIEKSKYCKTPVAVRQYPEKIIDNALPDEPKVFDISMADTSFAIDIILRDLAW